MLCCVSRRAVAGADLGPPYDHCSLKEQPVELEQVEAKQCTEADVQPILLPCAICARTFKPQSLEKHAKICERAANKKRKPFDSAKQRIQGTELAEFLPKQEKRRYVPEDRSSKSQSAWKQNHAEFLRAIRAARSEIPDFTMQNACGTTLTSSAPTRSNEQGICPTCNRHFGVKAYDRHVAWCKDRVARVPISPATNIAKERLEARMKYRAPTVKSRRQVTREKYSPGSAITLNSASKTSPTLAAVKAKESASAPSCKSDSPVKQKSLGKRPGQTKESPVSRVPMKSRPIDRTNRPPEDKPGPLSFRPVPPVKRISYLPVPPLKHTKEILEERDIIPSPTSCKGRSRKLQKRTKREEVIRNKQEEKHSARSPKTNIVSVRSQGNPKVNEVSINDIMGVTVRPCNIYRESSYTTWKQISREKICESNKKDTDVPKRFEDIDLCNLDDERVEEFNKEGDLNADNCKDDNDQLSSTSESLNWTTFSSKLNQTYSFKDLTNEEIEDVKISKKKWKPVKHSPRVEFCLGDLEKANRLRSSFSFIYPNELNLKGASRTSSRKGRIERTSSKDSTTENQTEDLGFSASNTKLPEEGFQSARSRILEKKRLNSANSQGNLGKNDELNCSTHDLNKENLKSPEKKLQSNESNNFSETYECKMVEAIIDNDTLEINQLKLHQDGSEKEIIERDSENIKKDDDKFNSDVKNSNQFLQNDHTDDVTKSCNIETDFIKMENLLRPARSSTPFINVEEYSKSENSTEESGQPPENFEWKMAVNVETGSEVLYRVESRDSNCSRHSSKSKFNKSRESNSKNKLLELQNCPSPREINTRTRSFSSLPSGKFETENYSPVRFSELLKKKQPESQEPFRKEIASQINMCNCSSNVSAILKCEKSIDCNDLTENISESSTQLCDIKPNDLDRLKEAEFSEESNENLENANYKREYIDTVDKTKEEVQEIYKNCTTKDFDYDSDNSVEQHMREAINNLKTSNQNTQSFILSESRVKVKKSGRSISKSYQSKILEIENKIHGNINILNESSDSLSSSMNGTDFTDIRQVESVEMETIEEIDTRNRNIKLRMLPEIRGATVVVKENYGKREKIDGGNYWEKSSKNRLINIDTPYQGARFFKRNPKVRILPPVPSGSSLIDHSGKDYNPFLLAEQQMNDLLSDTSEQSVTNSPSIEQNRETSFPLSHSSAFVKYPCQSLSSPEKRSSLIAPPSEFDDLVSDFSSDSTETNSLSREIFLRDLKDNKELKESISKSDAEKKSPVRELGRRVIIDKSKALGNDTVDDGKRGSGSFVGSSERARKILDKVSPKVLRPSVNRSVSVRASSAPKTTPDDSKKSSRKGSDAQRCSTNSLNNRNNNYANLSSSNLSLSSIVSSDMDIKRSNSLFDELMTSFEDENGSFSSLKSLLKNDPLSSPVHRRQRNGQISDEELSSPESYKRQDHSKLSADSAYSSLNRKYSHHGRSTNDVAGRLEEDLPRCNRREGDGVTNSSKCKMSNFCHECGYKFPETAKFCCKCGIKRLVL